MAKSTKGEWVWKAGKLIFVPFGILSGAILTCVEVLAAMVGVSITLIYFEPGELFYYILTAISLVIVIKTAYDFVKYRKRIRLLMVKDKEIRGTW